MSNAGGTYRESVTNARVGQVGAFAELLLRPRAKAGLAGPDDARLRDLPVVIQTALGAKGGKIRKTPLMRVEHDGSYVVVASMAGAPKHPVWYHNVVADPRVELQDGPVRQDMLAREVTGDEKAVWWARAVAAFPDYAEYQKKTDRQIPIFVLEPVARQH